MALVGEVRFRRVLHTTILFNFLEPTGGMRKKNQEKVSKTGFFAITRTPTFEIILKVKLTHNHNFKMLQGDDNTKLLQSEDKINYHTMNLKINLLI